MSIANDRKAILQEKADKEPRVGLREYLAVMGVSSIATMTAVGPGSVADYLQGGAVLGAQMGWVVVFAALSLWVVINMSNRTTCLTGKPPLELLADLWKPLAAIGFLLWFIPEIFIVGIQGAALAETAAALTSVPAQFIVWPTLLIVGLVFFVGTFNWIRIVASLLLTLLMVVSVGVAISLFFTGDLAIGDALTGLVVPSWPDTPETGALVAAAVGGAGSWGFLAYQGYSTVASGNNRPERLKLVNLDAFVLGFVLFFVFSIGVLWSAAGAFYATGVAPETAVEASDLFVPVLGEWARYLFLLSFLGALLTTTAGTVLILVTSVFAVLRAYGVGGERAQPTMTNPVYKVSLWIGLVLVAGGGSLLGGDAIISGLVWSLALLTVASPPSLFIWMYFINSRRYVGEARPSNVFNVVAVAVALMIAYLAVVAAPTLLSVPF